MPLILYRRKKWKRSLTRRNAFLPPKKAWRARDMSWFVEYLEDALISCFLVRMERREHTQKGL